MNSNRPLTRLKRNSMIGGVCSGIADWFGWEPSLVRILYVVLTDFSAAFPGVLIYGVLWLVLPVRR